MIHDAKEAEVISPLAGKPAPMSMLVDLGRLEQEYYQRRPEMDDPTQVVSFGTSGHRGSPFRGSFTEAHIAAITQAICDYRRGQRIDGPLYMGKDTHALSEPAQRTALEVLAANGVETIIQRDGGVTPTPVISWAILVYNRGRKVHLADGIVVTPSHNPPEDGGFKYNPPNGGPADTDVTAWVQRRANMLLRDSNTGVKRMPFTMASKAATTREVDLALPYVEDLKNVVDLDAIRSADVTLGVDPLGGAATPYWEPINSIYKVRIAVVNPVIDPAFSFMTVDHDGKIRMDPSSPYAMARLVGLKDQFRVAFANDPDSDRHGIVTRSAGLMNPNHFLAVAIRYLLGHRPQWPAHAAVGKTLVSSSVIDRVVERLGRRLYEVPVGFKWFVPGLFDGSCCFGGEESAGASFLRHNGSVWTTDKDGPIMNLLAAEAARAVEQTRHEPLEAHRHLGEPAAELFDHAIDEAAADQRLAHGGVGRPVGTMGEQVADRHREVVVGIHQPGGGGHDAVSIRVRIVGEGDPELILEPDEPRHRVGARRIHADLAVVVDRHERERRVDHRVDHGDVELVEEVDRLPVRSRSPTEWIDAQREARRSDRVRVDDAREIFDVRHDQISFVRGRGLDRHSKRHALHARTARSQQLVGPTLHPRGDIGIGGAAVRWVVLEAAILGRVVRRRDHDPVGLVRRAAAVVHENRPRDDGSRRDAPIALDDGLDAIGRQHLERGALGWLGERVRVLSHVERAVDALTAAVVADGLRDRADVGLGEGAVERRAAMAARTEADELRRIVRLGPALVVRPLEPGQVDQNRQRGRLAGQRGNRSGLFRVVHHRVLHHATGHALTCQMSVAYSPIVRSLENFPELATFKMALRAQASGSAYSARSLPSASR